jgi:signal transduction histidine kinase
MVSDFLIGGGELGELMRRHDWTKTPLGAPGQWPQSLRMAVRIMLTSLQPIWIGWGKELIYLYNDPYKSIIGGKHPWALGRPTHDVWREIWPDIEPLLATALGGDRGTFVESQLLIMERNGYPEETYYTFSYSPIPDDNGAVGGIICANSDDTLRVIGERQVALLRELASGTANIRSREEAFARSVKALATNRHDLPFAMLYVGEPGNDALSLVGTSGFPQGFDIHGFAQFPSLSADPAVPWPIAEALRAHETRIADISDDLFGTNLFGTETPTGAWDRAPKQAAILPISPTGETGRTGVLIVGLNPFRLFDESYRGFLELAAGQIAAALSSAQAYEEERKRAEALAELDRAKTTFFSNVSHEFRTPLTLMLGPIEDLLAASRLDAESHSQLELVHRNGVRLLRLVNSLLDFSRIEAGRMRANFEPTDLAAYTAEIASGFRGVIEKAGLSFTVSGRELAQPVYVDREMWEKVILNLLSNAFKFTLKGEIRVTIDNDENGGAALVRIADTGIGVAADQLPRLFERFHRVEGAQGRSFEGTGIGLALVQELVKLHGGVIEADSEYGRGTLFTIRLPFGSAHLPDDQVDDSAPSPAPAKAHAYVEEALRLLPDIAASGEAPHSIMEASASIKGLPRELLPGFGKRVLLADDNADMREYVRRLLMTQGYDVDLAEDGETALALARQAPPDLILTDVMMPKLDGFGVLRGIRSDVALASTPVLMLSARAGEEAKVEALDAAADDYLAKPFAARELLARVNSNIQMAAVRRDAERMLREQARKLESLNSTLEQRVEAEVAERFKVEEALRQAQKMEAIGQLTGGVAHDFNNLLTVIMGGLDTIRRSRPEDTARIQRAAEMAFVGTQRAAGLTNRLLAFSRRQPLAPRPLELNLLVRDMTELLHRTLGETVELETVLAPRLWAVEVDQNQLESAMLNLAVNARDAMPEGGKLTIETANTALDQSYFERDAEVIPGQYVVVSISDNGSGMSKDTLARAFEPFYTTKEVGRGTGLGLSMVYGFVKQSGGHVTLYSEEGHGTTVKLYFPRYNGKLDPLRDAPARPVPQASEGEVILVVEDSDDVRLYSASILRELGYRVLEASNADAALEIIRQAHRIDLLFTDVVLPGKNGRALVEAAKAIRKKMPVLYTTGYSRNAIVHHGRLDPDIDLISKPFTFDQLATRVRDMLDKSA